MWRILSLILVASLVLGTVSLVLVAGANKQTKFHPADLKIHDPIRQGNLTIFPVSNGSRAKTSLYLTLDEGLAAGTVKVGELGALRGGMVRPVERRPRGHRPVPQDRARVSELAIQNLSDRPLLLLAGEVVRGGKQDRVVARDRIVPPHSEPIPLGVFCVEPGRWHGLSAQFAASKAMAHPKLRQEVTETRDQQKVWDEVARANKSVAETLAAAPATGRAGAAGALRAQSSYARTMEARPVQDHLGGGSRAILPQIPQGAVGVVVAVNGQPVWADLFASPALFDRYRAKLLRSYLVEAIGSGKMPEKAPTAQQAREFLRALSGRQTIEVEPGIYRLVRTEAAGTVTYELQTLAPRPLTLHVARMAR